MDKILNKAGSYWFIQKANKKINSFGDDIDQYHASENVPGTSVKYVMDMVLVAQYFDTTKEIGASLKSSSSVFIPHRPSADIAMQIRDGLLQVDSTHISEA